MIFNELSYSKVQNKSQAASALVDEEPTDTAVFVNKKGELCLSIRAKPGANETRLIGMFNKIYSLTYFFGSSLSYQLMSMRSVELTLFNY